MRIILIAYDFPPSPSAGSARIGYLAKHLVRLGHEISIVTINKNYWKSQLRNDFLEKIESENKINLLESSLIWPSLDHNLCKNQNYLQFIISGTFRRLLRIFGFESQWNWIFSLNWIKSQLVLHPPYDLVLATGNPYVSFFLAKKISKYLHIPYFLDYRDLWNGNPHRKYRNPFWVENIEKVLLKGAAGVTVVSKSMKHIIATKYKSLVSEVYILTNGFDLDDLKSVKPHNFEQFAILYAGTIYPPKIVLTPVLSALKILKNKYPELISRWRFYYWGPASNEISNQIFEFELSDVAEANGTISRDSAREKIAGADLSLVITSVLEEANYADKGFVTSKIFDSLGLETNVLLIAPDDTDVEEIIEISKNGKRFSGKDIEGICEFIKNNICNQQEIPLRPMDFSWQNLIVGYSEFLKKRIHHSRLL